MYYGKRKAIIITLIVVILVVLLGAGAAFAFFATDMFKQNDEMFFKYMGEAIDDFKFVKNTQTAAITTLKENTPYTVDGEVTLNVIDEKYKDRYNGLNNAKVTFSSKVDKSEQRAYAIFDLISGNNKIFTLEYANTDDIYALNSAEVANAYIGIENKNLKEFTKKIIGNTNVDVSMLPDKIEASEYNNDLYQISEQEKKNIIDTYLPVIRESIPKEAFTKEKDIAVSRAGTTYNTTGYRLNLTGAQVKNLEVAILNTLKQDSITLNLIATKAKSLELSEDYTEVNNLVKVIDSAIQKVQNAEVSDVSIVIYVDNGKVISTDIILKNSVKCTVYAVKSNTNTNRNITISNLGLDDEFEKIGININDAKTVTQSTLDVSLNIDDIKNYTLYIENTGSAAEEYLDTKVEIGYEEEGKTFTIDYTKKVKFVDELEDMIKLDRSNCGVLNDYTAEQLKVLLENIGNRINEIVNEKTKLLGVNLTGGNIQPEINNIMKEQEIKTFNALFESYKGEITGTGLKALNTVVNKHNETDSTRKVVLSVDGVNVSGTTLNIKTTDNYIVEMLNNEEGYINQINVKLKTSNVD